jgi:elongation factor Tu
MAGYTPQFFFKTTNVTGQIALPENIDMVMPGDNTSLEVTLEKAVALEKGSHFAIREGGKTVGSGQVTEVL